MDKIELRFIQTMAATLIGEAVKDSPYTLLNPRTCQFNHEEGIVNLVPLLGNPSEMIVNESMAIHTYLNNDSTLDTFYETEVRNTVEAPPETENRPGLKLV